MRDGHGHGELRTPPALVRSVMGQVMRPRAEFLPVDAPDDCPHYLRSRPLIALIGIWLGTFSRNYEVLASIRFDGRARMHGSAGAAIAR
jgi:hypothetical protein